LVGKKGGEKEVHQSSTESMDEKVSKEDHDIWIKAMKEAVRRAREQQQHWDGGKKKSKL
jgi:hypothetical protein